MASVSTSGSFVRRKYELSPRTSETVGTQSVPAAWRYSPRSAAPRWGYAGCDLFLITRGNKRVRRLPMDEGTQSYLLAGRALQSGAPKVLKPLLAQFRI